MWNETLLSFMKIIASYGLILITVFANDHFLKRRDFNLRGDGRVDRTRWNRKKFKRRRPFKIKDQPPHRRKHRAQKSNFCVSAHLTGMRVSVFYRAFTGYLANRIPCQPLYYQWSKEHVIPKSILPNRVVTENPHNIIPMPRDLNTARSNKRYTVEWKDGYKKYACQNCPHPGYCRGSMVISPEGVHPPDYLKGPIARSVLYSVDTYPKYASLINDKVLSIDTAIRWDYIYPMSKEEREWLDSLSL